MSFNFLQDILSSEVIKNIILNTIFVSIPEEFFLVMFVYVMMGEFDHWKDPTNNRFFYKEDYVRVFVPVITTSILSNILRYSGIDNNIVSLVTIFVLFFSIVLFGDIFNNSGAIKWIGKVFLFLVLGVAVIFLCEFLYAPILLYGTGTELIDLNKDVFRNIIVSLPSRLLQYLFLTFFIFKKIFSGTLSLKKTVFENKLVFISTCILLILHVIFMALMTELIGVKKLFVSLQPSIRFLGIFIISIFPIINLFSLLVIIFELKKTEYIKNKELIMSIKQMNQDFKIKLESEFKMNNEEYYSQIVNRLDYIINLFDIEDKS